MKKKKIELITYKNDFIRTISDDIKNIDNQIKDLAKVMNHIMDKNNGIGLAGIQIGENKRIITIDLTKQSEDPIIKPLKITLINPVIISKSERCEDGLEGCLSVPGKQGTVERRFWIEIEALTLDGNPYSKKLFDLAARVAQHEIDHLNGILFIDKMIKQ